MKTKSFVSLAVMFLFIHEAVSQNIIEWPNATHLGGARVRLAWRTGGEINNYGWTVERRAHVDSAFRELPSSFVPGSGTTNEPHSYFWIDEQAPVGRICYRLRELSLDDSVWYSRLACVDVPTSVNQNPVVESFSLLQNYPNPFNPTTEIRYQIPEVSHVTLKVYDVLGREVATLVNEDLNSGSYAAKFNAVNIGSGVYFYKLQTGHFSSTRKMILAK